MGGVSSSDGGSNESSGAGSGFSTGGNYSGSIGQGQTESSGSSSSSSSSSSSDKIWDKQSPYLEDKYQNAQDLFNQQQPGLAAEAGFAGDYIKDVQGGAMDTWGNMVSDGAVNSYTDQMKGSIASDAGKAQDQMLAQMDARAAASGMSGGGRHGQAIGQGMTGINDAMLREQANIGFQAEEAAQGRLMAALGMSGDMANLGMQGFNPMDAQWSGLNNYNNIIGDPTKLTDTSSSSSSSSRNTSTGSNQNLGMGGGFNYGDQWNTSSSEGDGGSSFGVSIGASK